MALEILTYLYYFLLACVFFYSIKQKYQDVENDYLYINFAIIFLIDFAALFFRIFFDIDITGLYFILDLLNVIFVYYYFSRFFSHQKVLFFVGVISLIAILFFNNYRINQYSDYCSVVSCFYVIIVCLYGFYLIVESNRFQGQKIQNIRFFWFGTAMLLWCLMYLFRTIPRFYFQDGDKDFMQNLRIFFASVNLVTYALFFKLLLMYKKK